MPTQKEIQFAERAKNKCADFIVEVGYLAARKGLSVTNLEVSVLTPAEKMQTVSVDAKTGLIRPANNSKAFAIAWRWNFGKWGWASSMPSSNWLYALLDHVDGRRTSDAAELVAYGRSAKADMTRIVTQSPAEAIFINLETSGEFLLRIKTVCNTIGLETHPLIAMLEKNSDQPWTAGHWYRPRS